MATVREDVVKLSFDFDSRGMDRANDSVDDLLKDVQDLGGSKGTGKAEDGFDEATKAAKKFGNTDLSSLTSGLDKIVKSAGQAALKLGGMAVKGLAVGTAAATAGIVALGKSSIEGYAEFEQLVGGVETLFGAGGMSMCEYANTVGKSITVIEDEYNSMMKAQDTVLRNANNAYKTAGLSANDYMNTVTSFSASLINSLGGDTMQAAKLADQAIIDMADNANKMGTDISSIQDAYQGFAKQNYTMLDNLNTMGALAA